MDIDDETAAAHCEEPRRLEKVTLVSGAVTGVEYVAPAATLTAMESFMTTDCSIP